MHDTYYKGKPMIRVLGVIAGCVVAPLALGASTVNQASTPAGAGIFLALAVAYLTRRNAIGGWLLYFFMQLYVSLLVSFLFLSRVLENLKPSGWDDAFMYVLFFLSTVPVLVAQLAEVILATVLLFRRSESSVRFLRVSLTALLVTSAASLAIDIWKFNEALNIFFDVLTVGFSAIWLAYFSKSKRVRLVFFENAWNYDVLSAPRVITPNERRYLRKRAITASLATFVVLLLLMGAALEQKKPDPGLFAVPVFYALIAAAVGWYAPIRKKKRAALLGTASATHSKSEELIRGSDT